MNSHNYLLKNLDRPKRIRQKIKPVFIVVGSLLQRGFEQIVCSLAANSKKNKKKILNILYFNKTVSPMNLYGL